MLLLGRQWLHAASIRHAGRPSTHQTPTASTDCFCVGSICNIHASCTVQGALDRGVLHASDVKLWLQLMSTPIVGSLAKLFPAFRDRMLGNPRFLMVLAIEEAIGVAAKWSAEVNSRGDRFKKVCCFV